MRWMEVEFLRWAMQFSGTLKSELPPALASVFFVDPAETAGGEPTVANGERLARLLFVN